MRARHLIFAPALMVLGCGPSATTDFAGIWRENASPTSVTGAFASAFGQSSSLEMKKDHSFILALPDVHLSISANSRTIETESLVEGTWQLVGSKVTFETQMVGGQHLDAVRKGLVRETSSGSSGAGIAGTAGDVPPQPGQSVSTSSSTTQLTLPQDGSLSDDHKRLLLHFADGVKPPIELERDVPRH